MPTSRAVVNYSNIRVPYEHNQPCLAEFVEDADDKLFSQVLYNNNHMLNNLLPSKTDISYNLRHKRHNRLLIAKTMQHADSM